MSLSMYEVLIPASIRQLNNLSGVLKKAEAHALSRKIEPEVFINARLAPDMFPLSRQIQIVSDVVKGAGARLAGVEIPSYPDTEKTFPELYARIEKTIEFLKKFKAEQINGSEERLITLKMGGKEASFQGQPYLLNFVLPNLYFHASIAYAIIRHNGVDIGKKDYLGSF
ncbi:MAG: DUF1993 domain-containing protein [Candidatus Omnitrophica bacterium]|nr:DUF1993 domain-containing protein [Candidatus Omnitrophota bacterium]